MSPFDLYLEASLVLSLMLAVWWAASRGLRRLGQAPGWQTQRALLRFSFVAALASPLLLRALAALWPGWASSSLGELPGLASAVIALYFHGYLDIEPAALDQLVRMRESIRYGLSPQASPWALGLWGLLALGLTLRLGLLIRQAARLRGLLRRSHAWRRAGRLRLLVSDETAIPFSTGVPGRGRIVIPSWLLLHPADLRLAIAHEGQHLRGGDVAWAMLLEAAKLLFFWNPLVTLWAREHSRLAELACDEAVVARRRVSAYAYGDCLLRVSARASRHGGPARFAVGLTAAFGRAPRAGTFLATRIRSLAAARHERTPNRRGPTFAALILAATVSLALLAHDAGGWSAQELHLATVVNLKSEVAGDRLPAFGLVMSYW